jgi:hypothetical protein
MREIAKRAMGVATNSFPLFFAPRPIRAVPVSGSAILAQKAAMNRRTPKNAARRRVYDESPRAFSHPRAS